MPGRPQRAAPSLDGDLLEGCVKVHAAPTLDGPGHQVDHQPGHEDYDVKEEHVEGATIQEDPATLVLRVPGKTGQRIVEVVPGHEDAGDHRECAYDGDHGDLPYPPVDGGRLEHVLQLVWEH